MRARLTAAGFFSIAADKQRGSSGWSHVTRKNCGARSHESICSTLPSSSAITDKPALRGDVMYVAGCLFRAASFMTLVAYAMNRRWLINEKGAFRGLRTMRLRPRAAEVTIARVLANPGRTPKALASSIRAMKSLCGRFRTLAAREGLIVIDSGS